MSDRRALSAKAMARARQLGDEMARKEPLIRPRVVEAKQYESYLRFRNAHRAFWEQSERWDRHWQPRLFDIAEREAGNMGLSEHDSMRSWDVWYNRVVFPLKSALWETWELMYQLERLYNDALFSGRRVTAAQLAAVLRSEPESMPIAPVLPRRSWLSLIPFYPRSA